MNKIILFLIVILSSFAAEYKSSAEYTADSKKGACDKALVFAKENAMQQAGTFVSSQFNSTQRDGSSGYSFNKSNELKQFSQGMTKLKSKKNSVSINEKSYQFTCKVDAVFEVEVEKIKDYYQKSFNTQSKPKSIGTLKNAELEIFKLNQKIIVLQKQINILDKKLDLKVDDIKKSALLHGMLGIDSEYGEISGSRMTFGLVLNPNLVLKFGSGAEKAIEHQKYNTFELLDYGLNDTNSIYAYYYSLFGIEYYSFRYRDYFLSIGANIKFYSHDDVYYNLNRKIDNVANLHSEIYGDGYISIGYQYYRIMASFHPSTKTTYTIDNIKSEHQSSMFRLGLSLAIPIDL